MQKERAMSESPEIYDEYDNVREHGTPSERPPASTPLLESARADGYRWASLDVTDLDPPTTFPPY
jgi:hypothetical protein